MTVTIEGPHGVGKTLLAHKLAALLQSEGHMVTLHDGGFVLKRRKSDGAEVTINPRHGALFTEPRSIQIKVMEGEVQKA